MKKVIFFVTVAAVVMSVVIPAFASMQTRSYHDENYNQSDLGAFGLPREDKITVEVDIQSRWSPTGTETPEYSNHSASALSRRVSSATATSRFDAKAYLDMENVALEWNAYIDAALNSELGQAAVGTPEQVRSLMLCVTNLYGEFEITITVPNNVNSDENLVGIENEALTTGAAASNTTYQWPDNEMGYSVDDFFELRESTRTEDAEADTLTYTITMATKDDINEALDTYFAAITVAADDEKDAYRLELEIPNNTVGAVNTTPYEIEGSFSGSCTIDIGAYSQDAYTVYLGNDDDYENFDTVVPATDTELVRLTRTTTFGSSGGVGSSRPVTTPIPEPTAAPEPSEEPTEAPEAPELNTEEHFAYIIGYPDGSVQPEGTITREEVATIFFRLLTDESRNRYWSQNNPYPDVAADRWSNNAISTMTNAGIVSGYHDGTFMPERPITRAEFAAVAARFDSDTYEGEDMFTDIHGHWATDSINRAVQKGWIKGYEDGTFRPDEYITRAEAMTLINRMLDREVDADAIANDAVFWPDNDPNAWYYTAVEEATNSHDYTVDEYDEEQWTEVNEPRDWALLEQEWSDANSAGSEDDIY